MIDLTGSDLKALTAQQNSLSPSTALNHLFLKPNTTKNTYAYTPQRGELVVNVKTIFSPGENRAHKQTEEVGKKK